MAATAVRLSPEDKFIRICDRINEGLLYLTLLAIPLFFIIFTRDQFELPKLTIFRVLTWLMLGVWGLRILAAKKLAFRTTPLDLPILVWSGLQILTTVITVSPYVSYRGEYENFRGLLTVLNYTVLYYLAVNFIRTREQINRLLFVIMLAGLLTTVYGIAQFFGIDFIAWNPASIVPGRYFSTLGNPNFLAAYLAMVMPLLVIFFIETASAFRKTLLLICFITMFTALLGTWSRGGLLALLAALSVLAAFGLVRAYRTWQQEEHVSLQKFFSGVRHFSQKHRGWMLLLGIITAILLAISATFGRHHVLRMADTIIHLPSALKISRLHIWLPALGMIRDYPILGTGLDTFKTVFPRYATPAFAAIDGANVSSRTAHNEILQVLATQGVIGFLIVSWLTFMILKNWWRAYLASAKHWQDRLVLVGMLSVWAAYSVQNLFSFGVVAIDSFYWIVIALVVLLQLPPDQQTKAAPSQEAAAKPVFVFSLLGRFRLPAGLGVVVLALAMGWFSLKDALADYAYNLGTVYRMQQMGDASLAAFSKAAELTPTEVKYIVYQGLAYEEKAKQVPPQQQMDLIKAAIRAYARGVEMNRSNAYYLGNLGRAYALADAIDPANRDYYAKAIDYYRQAIRYAPVTVLFYQNLAMTYLAHQQETDFREVTDRLAAFNKSEASALCFTAGNQFYTSNQWLKAKEYYEHAVVLQPDNVEAHFNLGVTLAQLKQIPQAVAHWQKALELKPDFTPAQQMLDRVKTHGSQTSHEIMLSGAEK